MKFTKEQKKEAYKKLSPEMQSLIMDSETTDLIENLLTENGILDTDSADSEILYAMYGLQTLSEAMANIAKLSNKNVNDLSVLKSNLEKNIFKKIPNGGNTLETSKISVAVLKTKITEIANKYSLNDTQNEILISYIITSINNSEQEEVSIEKLVEKLNISRLLAEQILEDLQNRVFEHTLNYVDKIYNVDESKPRPIVQNTPVAPNKPVSLGMDGGVEKEKTLEIRPETLPAQPSYISMPSSFSKPTFQNPVLDSQKKGEPSPIGVPRYAHDIGNTPPPNSIVEKKLNSVTPSNSSPIKYEKDPYREPLL